MVTKNINPILLTIAVILLIFTWTCIEIEEPGEWEPEISEPIISLMLPAFSVFQATFVIGEGSPMSYYVFEYEYQDDIYFPKCPLKFNSPEGSLDTTSIITMEAQRIMGNEPWIGGTYYIITETIPLDSGMVKYYLTQPEDLLDPNESHTLCVNYGEGNNWEIPFITADDLYIETDTFRLYQVN